MVTVLLIQGMLDQWKKSPDVLRDTATCPQLIPVVA